MTLSEQLTHLSLRQIARMVLAEAGPHGMTIAEFREHVEGHHGSMSGTLSNLHYEGEVATLKQQRDGCHPYVLVANVNGRETVPQRGKPTEIRARDKRVADVVARYMVPRDDLKPGMTSDQSKGERFAALMARDIRAAWGEIE